MSWKQVLKQKNGFTIPEMQAYLSVYFRLKNKLAVEDKLSPEEKSSRGSWAREALETRKSPEVTVSEPSGD
ncbi:MAG TPA: hypothetical protein VLB80_03800 [Candidatus Babeliales bacterium]|nr:hypothetical protein [Candidatus Babeliales bacterium]